MVARSFPSSSACSFALLCAATAASVARRSSALAASSVADPAVAPTTAATGAGEVAAAAATGAAAVVPTLVPTTSVVGLDNSATCLVVVAIVCANWATSSTTLECLVLTSETSTAAAIHASRLAATSELEGRAPPCPSVCDVCCWAVAGSLVGGQRVEARGAAGWWCPRRRAKPGTCLNVGTVGM